MKNSFKRFLSIIIDTLSFVLLFSTLVFVSQNLIVNNVTNYKDLVVENNQILLDSGLFEQDGNNIVLISDNYDNKITAFYQDNTYYDLDKKTTSYNDAKEKSGLFIKISEGVYIPKNDVDDEQLEAFYKTELEKAKVSIANREDYKLINKKINQIMSINTFCVLFLTSFIVLFIVPICNKNHGSLGNVLLKLKVFSDGENKTTPIQLFMRFVAFFAIELLPSLTFYGITFIISFILIIVTKNNKSIHDYFSLTYVKEVQYKEIQNEKTHR